MNLIVRVRLTERLIKQDRYFQNTEEGTIKLIYET